jgi:hypothetical protein
MDQLYKKVQGFSEIRTTEKEEETDLSPRQQKLNVLSETTGVTNCHFFGPQW